MLTVELCIHGCEMEGVAFWKISDTYLTAEGMLSISAQGATTAEAETGPQVNPEANVDLMDMSTGRRCDRASE